MAQPRMVPRLRGWSAKPDPGPGFIALGAVNVHTAQQDPRSDKGYKILRQVQTSAFNKGGGSFTHVHTDGTEYPFYWYDGQWWRDDGAGVTSLVSGLGDYFVPAVVHFDSPGGVSAAFIGDNAKAYGFRKETDLAAFLWDMDVPGGSFTATPSGTGGSLPTGTYHVAVTQIDTTGARTVESGAIFQTSVSVTGPTGKITLDLTGVTYATRATKYRVYLSNSANSASSYFQNGADTPTGTTSFVITTTTAGTAIPGRGTIYQSSKMPVTAVDTACIFDGRMIFASSGDPHVYWSERGDVNHFYSTNSTDIVEGGFNAPVVAVVAGDDAVYVLTARGVHKITGDFGRNDDLTPRVEIRTIDHGVGCTARGSVVAIPGVGVFFMSQYGPIAIVNGTLIRLGHDDFADFLPLVDFTYADRWTATFDQRLRQYVCFLTRKTNSNRSMDGAVNAGICDIGIRWNLDELNFSPPLHYEVTHVNLRNHPSSPGNSSNEALVVATGPHGDALHLHQGRAAGITGDVSGAVYDSVVPTTFTATQAVIGNTGYGDLQGVGVTLRYPSTDTAYPTVAVYRTIKSSSEAAGATTINWEGNAPTPTGTNPSTRVGGMIRRARVRAVQLDENPLAYTRLNFAGMGALDIVGMEARS